MLFVQSCLTKSSRVLGTYWYVLRQDRAKEIAVENAKHFEHSHGNEDGDKLDQRKKAAKKNTSVYVTGLTTYIACKQLGI